MNLYPVTVDWIPGLPQIPFHDGPGRYKRVVMHQTANPNDTARMERNFEAGDFNHAFVHEFIDPNEIIQAANPQFLAYGAGHIANQDSIHLELCTSHNQVDFERSFDMWCQRAAVHLSKRQLGVSPAERDGSGTLWSHRDVSKYLGDTNHTDPIEYLTKWGKSWRDVIDRVQKHYQVITGKYPVQEAPIMDPKDAQAIIQNLQKLWGLVTTDAEKQEIHRQANVVRKAAGIPTT